MISSYGTAKINYLKAGKLKLIISALNLNIPKQNQPITDEIKCFYLT